MAEPIPQDALPTPALVLDRQSFERNLVTMRDHLAAHGKAARPHSKTHKCPLIAFQQLEHGAVGLCVAKTGEAVAMASAGVPKVLVTSPVTHAGKLSVLSEVASSIDQLDLVVDSMTGADLLVEAWPEGVRLGIVLDFDVQMGRTGNRSADELKRIRDRVLQHPSVVLTGAQHYAGNLMHISKYAERRDRSLAAWHQAVDVMLEVFEDAPGVITGSGTGTYDIDVAVGAITDLQVGSYIFMDREYVEIESATGPTLDAFEPSLFVVCSAISSPTGRGVTVDGGYKAFASDTVTPGVVDLPDGEFFFAGDEHGVVVRRDGDQEPLLGGVLSFMVPHCDPTVNLHDAYWVRDADGLIRERWPITGRGAAW